jgi:transglutaminase-like putative cysteine protease
VLDLRDQLDPASRPSPFTRTGTWTEKGHARIAESLEGPLREQLLTVYVRRARGDLAPIRDLVVRLEPRLGRPVAEAGRAQVAAALRNFVHRRVALGASSSSFAFLPLYSAFRSALAEPGVAHSCGGLALFHMAALEAFGIPARYVGAHASPTLAADSHASVEYHDGHRWVASDPTFNVRFADRDRPLGWLEVRERVLAGVPVQVSSDGYAVARSRRIESYYAPLERLLAFMVIYTDRDGDGLLEADEVVTIPADWDGSLRNDAGPCFRHSPDWVYRVLGSHPPDPSITVAVHR